MTSRRQFLQVSSATALAACGGVAPEVEGPAPATFSKALGAQLYTLRFVLPDDPAGVLGKLAEIGYEEAEVLQIGFSELKPMITGAGLKPKSMHLMPPVVTGTWGDMEKPADSTIEAAAEIAAGAGIGYLVMPYLLPGDRGSDLDHYKKLAEKLNAAGAVSKAAGLGFAYHNHAFEFEPMGESTPFDTLVAETDPDTVGLELDVFWVSVAGHDPAEVLRKYPGRVPLVHLKDKAAGQAVQFNEKVTPETFKEVGNGSIDFASVVAACADAGVEYYFVEQDQTTGDPLASLRQSYDHLRSIAV